MKKQRLIPMIIVFIMIVNCLLPIIPVKAIDNNAIYLNESLYEALKAELTAKGIVASYSDAQHKITITEENRSKVTSLDLKNREISDLTGLEKFTKLEEVNLSGNRLTSESNLEVLNNFQLKKLDISSNYIEDISMIENYEEIEILSIQNQTIEKVTVLDKEAIENLEEGKIKLPQIFDLIENIEEFIFDDQNRIERYAYSLSAEDNAETYSPVKIYDPAPHSITMNLYDEEGNIKSGSIGFTFKINFGELINTTMNLYYVVINEDQRAAVFNDDNFYNAVKEQLTQGQEINKDLDTDSRNLYHRAYDVAKVMVFDINTLINEIPSLKVSGKEIVDISGIETFVGLEKELDLSNNYIDSIEKLKELQTNKDKETALLQERFKEHVEDVSEVRSELVALLEEIESIEKEIEAKLEEMAENPENAEEIDKALNGYIDEESGKPVEGLYQKKEKVVVKANAKLQLLKVLLKELYVIYSNYYRTTTLLTVEISQMDELKFNSKEEAIDALNLLFTKIANLEATKSLSDFEKELLIKEFYMPLADEEGNEIANPIEAFFMKVLEKSDELTIGSCKNYINKIIEIDTKAQLNYNFPSIYANGKDVELPDNDQLKAIVEGNWEDIKTEMLLYSSELVEGIIENIDLSDYFNYSDMRLASNWLDVVRKDATSTMTVRFTKEEQTAFEKAKIEEEVKLGTKDISIEVNNKMQEIAKADLQNLTGENRVIVEKFVNDPTASFTETEFAVITNLYFEKAKEAVINGLVEEKMKTLPVSAYETKVVTVETTDESVIKVLSQVLGISGKVVNLTEEEIKAWVEVPELKNINLNHNCITNAEGIECIKGLEILNLGRNEIFDISNIKWEELTELKELYLQENAISDISMLDVVKKLERLNVSKNKLSGKFNLDVEKLERLEYADFSENAYTDLRNLFVNYTIEAGMKDIYKYVYDEVIVPKGMIFDGQQIKADLGKVVIGGNLYLDVPPIITQLERMKPADTYFYYEGPFVGKVSATGKAQLATDELGRYTATFAARSEEDERSFGYVIYRVNYEVVEGMLKDVDIYVDENRNYAIIDGETKFIASVEADENVTDVSVNWTVEGNVSTDTEINSNGVLYVAPDETAKELTVIATSNYDNSKTSRITLEVKKAAVEVFITSSSNQKGIKTETSKQYDVLVSTEAKDKRVDWSIKGNTSAETKISEDGVLYVAKDEAAGGKLTVVATSKYDNTAFNEIVEVVVNDEYTGEIDIPERPVVKPEEPNPGDTTTPVDPNPGDTTTPVDPNPGDTTIPEEPSEDKVEVKYDTKDDMVYVEKPNTTIADFVKGLVDGEHTVVVTDGKGNAIVDSTKVVTTGMTVLIDDEIVYEIVITGDINGDGVVDSMDSNLVKAHRVETKKLEGVNFEAADINKDGKVNKIDSFLLLYFRADKIDDFSKTTIEAVMK